MQLFLTSAVSFVARDIATKMDAKNKKLAFIYTAAEVEEGGLNSDWCQADRKSLVDIGFEVSDYTISDKTMHQLDDELDIFDAIYVSGGNSFYLLQQAQKSGFMEIITKLILEKGKTYIGTSAGSIVAGPDIYPVHRLDKMTKAPELNGFKGFNLVNFCIFPHWGSDHFRDRYLNQRLEHAYREDQVPIVILTDKQYVWVKDGKFEIVEVK